MVKLLSIRTERGSQFTDTDEWESDLVPFAVAPSAGEIFPGKSGFIQVSGRQNQLCNVYIIVTKGVRTAVNDDTDDSS